jgi:hypothetical protein
MKTFGQAAGLPGFAQSKTYAAHRVWKGSARLSTAIKTPPLSRKEAARLYHDARRFERQTRGRFVSAYRPGKISTREGKLGNAGLAVLHALLFDFLNNKTGRMDPQYSTIARAACISIATVGRALARLKAAGVLNWIPRCTDPEHQVDGGWLMRQTSNLYAVQPVGQWRGYSKPADPPAPEPEAWGAAPALPSLGVTAGMGARAMAQQLGGAPPGSLGEALARATKRRQS